MLVPALSLFPSPVNEVTVKDFLSDVINDDEVAGRRKSARFMSWAPGNTSGLNSMQYRYKLDEKNAYSGSSLRMYLNGLDETSAASGLSSKLREEGRIGLGLLINRKIRERYMLLVKHDSDIRLRDLYAREISLLTDRVNVLKRNADLAMKQMNLILESERGIEAARAEIIDLEKSMSHSLRKVSLLSHGGGEGTNFSINYTGMVSVAGIEKKMERIMERALVLADNIYHKKAMNELHVTKDTYEFELSRERRYFNYVEFSLDRNNKYGGVLDRDLRGSLEFAFTLPHVTSGNIELNSRQSAYIVKESEVRFFARNLKLDIGNRIDDLKVLLEKYKTMSDSESVKKGRHYIRILSKSDGSDPLLLIDLYGHILKHDIAVEKVRLSVFTAYLDMLDLSGMLVKQPVMNFLSEKDEHL